MQLRPYQLQGVQQIQDFFKSGGLHCIRQAATGSGKTKEFTYISKLVSEKNKKVLIMTNRAEILYQAGGSIKEIGLKTIFIQAGAKIVPNNFNVFVAMSQTLRNRINDGYWITFLNSIDLLIIDECHSQDFNYLFESKLFDNKHVIGYSATPKRGGKMRQLALDYETIITGISVKELINESYLVNDDYYGFGAPDLSDCEFDYLKGDYKDSSLFKKFNNPKTYSGAIKAYQTQVNNSKAICFCVNIEHCINTAIEFNKNGIDAKFIVSELSKPMIPENKEDLGKMARHEERKRIYDLYQENKHLTGSRKTIFTDFKNNKFKVLINAGIATTGYDEPSIESVIILRATLSTTLWLQMLGRGSRPFKNKAHFNILDFGGNAERLGHYTESRVWSLWHEQFEGNGLPPIKECGIDSSGKPLSHLPGCRRPILAAYNICPFCGFKYPEKEHKEIDLELIIFDQQIKRGLKTKRLQDMSNLELKEYREIKGHKMAWLWRQLWYRGGEDCIKEFGNEFNWSSSSIERAIEYMQN